MQANLRKSVMDGWAGKALAAGAVPTVGAIIGMYVTIARLEERAKDAEDQLVDLQVKFKAHTEHEATLWDQLSKDTTQQLLAFTRLEAVTNQIKEKQDGPPGTHPRHFGRVRSPDPASHTVNGAEP